MERLRAGHRAHDSVTCFKVLSRTFPSTRKKSRARRRARAIREDFPNRRAARGRYEEGPDGGFGGGDAQGVRAERRRGEGRLRRRRVSGVRKPKHRRFFKTRGRFFFRQLQRVKKRGNLRGPSRVVTSRRTSSSTLAIFEDALSQRRRYRRRAPRVRRRARRLRGRARLFARARQGLGRLRPSREDGERAGGRGPLRPRGGPRGGGPRVRRARGDGPRGGTRTLRARDGRGDGDKAEGGGCVRGWPI